MPFELPTKHNLVPAGPSAAAYHRPNHTEPLTNGEIHMTEPCEETIRIWHPDGREHQLTVLFASSPAGAVIGAVYVGGTDPTDPGETVARWTATYESPMNGDPGHVWIGNGRIDLEIESLRGIGIGSLLMLPLVRWAKERPCNVTVVPINLAGSDADTEAKRCIRNRFYEKLGFVFNYEDDGQTFGKARKMPVSELITPDFKMSRGWQVASLSATGKVF